MTILITGAGVIGSLTATMLAAKGEPVVLADIRQPSDMPGITPVILDITDIAGLERVVDQHRVTRIIHTAALLSNGIRQSPLDGIRTNIMGTANILDVARRKRLGRIVIASSTTVGYPTFGSHGPGPIEEDFSMRVIGERPASIYAATKLAAEHLALLHADLYQVDCLCLRYGAVIGGSLDAPTSVPGQLVSCLAAAARAGHGRIDNPLLAWGGREEFVDARDCARANVLALDAPAPGQRVFNIANGAWHTMQEFIEAGRQALGSFALEILPEPATGFAGFPYRRPARSDLAAATQWLGFAPVHDLVDSIGFWGRGGLLATEGEGPGRSAPSP